MKLLKYEDFINNHNDNIEEGIFGFTTGNDYEDKTLFRIISNIFGKDKVKSSEDNEKSGGYREITVDAGMKSNKDLDIVVSIIKQDAKHKLPDIEDTLLYTYSKKDIK